MLRRTRADQVVGVYEEALRRYPTMDDLAAADPDEVRGVLRPLGLAWRADDVVSLAREVAARYGGRVPGDVEDLKSLTGVGDYVANAVACFAGREPRGIVDTNVVRLIGRIFGLPTDPEARRRKPVREAIDACLDRRHPQQYNYAILDFAAAVCTPSRPRCAACPFRTSGRCDYAARHQLAPMTPKPKPRRIAGHARRQTG
ncbi:DNA glycosylase [Candidatus Binatia bacterium]|nr:DNA glycosylase [Candidatus Binatia bacterium]